MPYATGKAICVRDVWLLSLAENAARKGTSLSPSALPNDSTRRRGTNTNGPVKRLSLGAKLASLVASLVACLSGAGLFYALSWRQS
jgi:hypothetical protein